MSHVRQSLAIISKYLQRSKKALANQTKDGKILSQFGHRQYSKNSTQHDEISTNEGLA